MNKSRFIGSQIMAILDEGEAGMAVAQLARLAKQRGVVVTFVGHVTKEGARAC